MLLFVALIRTFKHKLVPVTSSPLALQQLLMEFSGHFSTMGSVFAFFLLALSFFLIQILCLHVSFFAICISEFLVNFEFIF